METKETSKKGFYLKWPWNILVYIVLVAILRIISIPVILLIMWWNKKQQPDGPEEGYYLIPVAGVVAILVGLFLALPEPAGRPGPGKERPGPVHPRPASPPG